jgi:hypothetical protein
VTQGVKIQADLLLRFEKNGAYVLGIVLFLA